MQTIVFTDICGSVAHHYEFGDDPHTAELHEHTRSCGRSSPLIEVPAIRTSLHPLRRLS
jgi:hypothetical protein